MLVELLEEKTAFEGCRRELLPVLGRLAGQFYTYVLCRPDGREFYVGKGLGRRVLEHELEARRNHVFEINVYKCRVIRKILNEGGEIIYRIDRTFPTDREDLCLLREAELIARYGMKHNGGSLANLTGGLGSSGSRAPSSFARQTDTLAGKPKDKPDVAVLNTWLLGFGPVGSVPVKPVSWKRGIEPSSPHEWKSQVPSIRMCLALMASASAHGLVFVPGVEIPRSFTYLADNELKEDPSWPDIVEGFIENGCSRDILTSRLATLVPAADPREERFKLDAAQLGALRRLVGDAELRNRGLLPA